MRFRSLRLLTVLALACSILPLARISTAHADGITVIPPRFETFGNPGDTLTQKIRVVNNSTTSNTYSTQVDNFTALGDTGQVNLLDKNQPSTTYSLAQWITTEPSQFTIPAGQEQVVTVTIKIPKTGEPGGHYASVLVKRGGQSTPGGAAVDSQVGTLFLLTVTGNVKEAASVTSFNAEESFAQYGPVKFDLITKNEGNVHEQPTGTIVITNMFGKTVKTIPLNTANVLPGAERLVTTSWDETNLIGRYTATLVATYGQISTSAQNQLHLTASTTFVVFPLYILWILIGIIVIIALLITQRSKIKRAINRLTSD